MVRTPSVDKNGIRRGAWSEEEDNILKAYVLKHGNVNWRQLPRFTGLARCGKSCRLRWKNYLKPGIKRGNYTKEEVKQIIKLREEFGNKWSLIASKLSGRTDNEIKNYWHTHLKNPTKHGLIISTHENVENLDQIHVIESMEQIISSSKAVDSFPQPQVPSMTSNSLSLEHWDSIYSFQAFEEFCHRPFLFNTSNDLTTQSLECNMRTEPVMLDTSNSHISASTIYNLGLSDDVARSFGGEPFMLDNLNTQISPSTIYDLGLSDEVARSFGSEPFLLDTLNSQISASPIYNSGLSNEVARGFGSETFSLDTLDNQISVSTIYDLGLSDEIAGRFGSEPFSLDTLDNQISASTIYDLGLTDEIAGRFGSEPFSLHTLDNQISTSTIYDLGLSDEIAGSFEIEPFTLDTLNCDYALSSVDWSSWTQPIIMHTSSNDSIFYPAISNIEECMAPFMPLAAAESDLINLFSAVYSLNGDE